MFLQDRSLAVWSRGGLAAMDIFGDCGFGGATAGSGLVASPAAWRKLAVRRLRGGQFSPAAGVHHLSRPQTSTPRSPHQNAMRNRRLRTLEA